MVWFQCDDCGENLKKPKLLNHFRCCSASRLSCIDCGSEFDQRSVQQHTQCVSETVKYGPKGAQAKAAATASPASMLKEEEDEALSSMGLSSRPPWNCSLCNVKATSRETLGVHGQGKKHKAKARAAVKEQKSREMQQKGSQGEIGGKSTEMQQKGSQGQVEGKSREMQLKGSQGQVEGKSREMQQKGSQVQVEGKSREMQQKGSQVQVEGKNRGMQQKGSQGQVEGKNREMQQKGSQGQTEGKKEVVEGEVNGEEKKKSEIENKKMKGEAGKSKKKRKKEDGAEEMNGSGEQVNAEGEKFKSSKKKAKKNEAEEMNGAEVNGEQENAEAARIKSKKTKKAESNEVQKLNEEDVKDMKGEFEKSKNVDGELNGRTVETEGEDKESAGGDKRIRWRKLVASELKAAEGGMVKLKKLVMVVVPRAMEQAQASINEKAVKLALNEYLASSSKFEVHGKYVRFKQI